MGRSAVTALVAVLLAAGTGCGAEETAREAVDPVAEAAERTAAAGGARIDGLMTLEFPGAEIEFTIDGVVDFENERSRLRMDTHSLPPAARREAGMPHETIRDGLSIYVTNTTLRTEIEERWAMADLEAAAESAGLDTEALSQWDESNPRDLLRFLEAAGGAKETGRERIRGEPTTRYSASVSVERYAEIVAADEDEEYRRAFAEGMRRQLGSDTIDTRVWLSDDGLIRREEVDMDMVIEGEKVDGVMRLDLRDFGAEHEVALPDEGDVKDVTDEWDRYKVHFTG